MKKNKLSAIRRRFVDEYMIDQCASRAAVRAGYKPDHADVIGYQLLQVTLVSDAIKKNN